MTSAKVFNLNRAFDSAVALTSAVYQGNSDVSDADLLAAVEALTPGLYKILNDVYDREGLALEDDLADTAPARPTRGSSSRASSNGRRSSSSRSSGARSSRGSSGGGKGKGLTDKQVGFVNKMRRKAIDDGFDPSELPSVESIEAIYDFGERGQHINLLRMYAYYNGDEDQYYDDPDNEDKPLPA
jgi:hypothetical protein